MSVEHVPAVYQHASRGGSHLVILLTIAFHSDRHGEWTTDQATLQQRARLGRRHVKQILDDLVAAGELAVASHHGRGKHSTYRLLIGPENMSQTAAILTKPEPETTFPDKKPEAPLTFPVEKPEPQAIFPHPPCPPFPPNPQSPLNPPEKLKQETFGLAPAAPQPNQAPSAPELRQELLVSPLPFGEGGSGTHGRGAGGEGLPLPPHQNAVFRVNLLLEEAAIPLPSPSQIALWCKTLDGIEPLLELLRQLIQAGLATKRTPSVYVHRVVMERAARPEPARFQPRRPGNPLLAAGSDAKRSAQADQIIANKRGGDW